MSFQAACSVSREEFLQKFSLHFNLVSDAPGP